MELPRAVPVASPSPKNASPTFADQELDKSSTSQQNGRRAKHHDPARDLSIQVLEKFSLVTRFARETTSQLFRESQLDGFTPIEGRKDSHMSPVHHQSTTSDEPSKGPDVVSVAADPVEVILLPLCISSLFVEITLMWTSVYHLPYRFA